MKAMSMLAERGLVSAAIDNSDGLLPSLSQISEASSLTAVCDLDMLTPPDDAQGLEIDPVRCWLGWGDWNVVAAVPRSAEADVHRVARSSGTVITIIGELRSGDSSVVLRRGGREKPAWGVGGTWQGKLQIDGKRNETARARSLR